MDKDMDKYYNVEVLTLEIIFSQRVFAICGQQTEIITLSYMDKVGNYKLMIIGSG